MSPTPRVSIGLAVYNGETFLEQTLDSIVVQTFEDFELVISDNASTDRTAEICKTYAASDPRIKYHRNSVNIGVNNNFNRVFHLSSGRYFRWSAGDDLFSPTSLEVCVDVLDRQAEVILCYPKTVLIDADGVPIGPYDDNMDCRSTEATKRFRQVLENLALVNIHYGLMRSDALKCTSLYGEYAGSDLVLLAELALYGQFWEIPQQLFFRRLHDGASSALKNQSWDTVQEFFHPAARGGLDLYHWKHRFHNLGSIYRSPISAVDKLSLSCIVGRQALRARHVYIKELREAGRQLWRKWHRRSVIPAVKS